MKQHLRALLALLLLAQLAADAALAQSGGGFDLTWSTVDGGGAESTGGTLDLTGTSGQPDAGTLSGGSLTLQGGFWPGVQPNSTATPSPTATPPPCPSGARVNVQAVANGDGRLRVTLTTAATTLISVSFTTDPHAIGNGLVDAPAPAQPVLSATPPPASITLPGSTPTYTFFVRRASAGQPTTLPLTVTDNCGTWPTFVGGGPGAF